MGRLLAEMEALRKAVVAKDSVSARLPSQRFYESLSQQVWEMRTQLSALQTQVDMAALRSELDELRAAINMDSRTQTSVQALDNSQTEGTVYDGHPVPEWGPTLLFGAEYEVSPEPQKNLDVECAVCVSPRPLAVMVPGTNTCHPGWTVEYTGSYESLAQQVWQMRTQLSALQTQVDMAALRSELDALRKAPQPVLCVCPSTLFYDNRTHSGSTATLYGGEYEVHNQDNHDLDAECAVCVSPRPLTVMVPATNTCHPGWTVEYTGYLMAGHHSHWAATEFICVDGRQDARLGSKADHDGKLSYYTVGKCGSLPCPPYEEDRVITCVVCSK
nr:hypothetical protein BaRGS_023112 [Batillaria attramentaria]